MKSIQQAIKEYLEYRNRLGFALVNEKRLLKGFASFMKRNKAEFVTCKLALAFAKINPKSTRKTWSRRLGVIRLFAMYHSVIDHRTEIPPAHLLPASFQRRSPFIYTDNQITLLLECCKQQSSIYEIERYSYFMIFGLLAITGTRISEITTLNRDAVDLLKGIITIHQSKFKKSRYLPIHRSTVNALHEYLDYRDRYFPNPASSYFFIDHLGMGIPTHRIRKVFRKLLIKIGLRRKFDRGARLTDFRHTFATKTLIHWYQHGLNVDQQMPLLSTYLGHVHPSTTYWYLTVTPELLRLVLSRFTNYRRKS